MLINPLRKLPVSEGGVLNSQILQQISIAPKIVTT